MGKTKFFIRLGVVAAGWLLIVAAIFYTRYSKYPRRSLALVHVSNSLCYNSNLQNLVSNTDVDRVQCLILGSSISLNNLSAQMIEDSLGQRTYNLSSWGFPVGGAIDFFSTIHPQQCRRVVVAFNNIDFASARAADPGTANATNYNFRESGYFLQGNRLVKLLVILKTFNFMRFNSDTRYKDSVIRRSPLDFDTHGSALLDPDRFPRDEKKLPVYKDTTGFRAWDTNLLRLRALLKKENSALVLVYSPYRAGTLSNVQLLACDKVAEQMRKEFGSQLVDLHRESIADSLYWDAAHLYRDGAIELTKRTISVIKEQKGI